MNEVLSEERQRIGRIFLSYSRIVLGGMLFATLCFFIYAGVKANYIPVELLAALFSLVIAVITFVLSFAYFYVSRRRRSIEAKRVEYALSSTELKRIELALSIMILRMESNQLDRTTPKREIVHVQDLLRQLHSRKLTVFEFSDLTDSQLRPHRSTSQLDEKILRLTYLTAGFVRFVMTTMARGFEHSRVDLFSRSRHEDQVEAHIVE